MKNVVKVVRRTLPFLLAASLVSVAHTQTPDPDPLARYVYPLSKARKTPRVEYDVKDIPELQPWAEKAKALVKEWYPTLTQLLSTKDYKPYRRIKLTFKQEISAPAWAANGEITFSGKWIKAHPDDLGMVIHELTHVVQNYPDNKVDTGWLVEGIADYIRWWRYEPESTRSRIDITKATYHDAYRTTAYFLAWVSQKYDRRLVPSIDLALRKGEDPMPIFTQLTGKDPQTLWTEFVPTLQVPVGR